METSIWKSNDAWETERFKESMEQHARVKSLDIEEPAVLCCDHRLTPKEVWDNFLALTRKLRKYFRP